MACVAECAPGYPSAPAGSLGGSLGRVRNRGRVVDGEVGEETPEDWEAEPREVVRGGVARPLDVLNAEVNAGCAECVVRGPHQRENLSSGRARVEGVDGGSVVGPYQDAARVRSGGEGGNDSIADGPRLREEDVGKRRGDPAGERRSGGSAPRSRPPEAEAGEPVCSCEAGVAVDD